MPSRQLAAVTRVLNLIFDLDGEALIMRIDRRTLGDGPRFQYAVKFEPEIIVQARSGVFLDYEAPDLRLARQHFPRWVRRSC